MTPTGQEQQQGRSLPDQVADWIRKVGFERTELGIHFYDVLDAARRVEAELHVLVTTDPSVGAAEVGRALDSLGRLNTWLFTEIKHHVGELENSWGDLERHIEQFEPTGGDSQ